MTQGFRNAQINIVSCSCARLPTEHNKTGLWSSTPSRWIENIMTLSFHETAALFTITQDALTTLLKRPYQDQHGIIRGHPTIPISRVWKRAQTLADYTCMSYIFADVYLWIATIPIKDYHTRDFVNCTNSNLYGRMVSAHLSWSDTRH